MAVAVLNTDANLSGNTLAVVENVQTVTGLWTFDRDPSAPFGVAASSAVVPNLDADKLDGVEVASLLRSDAADIKTAGDLTFNDSIAAVFGTGGDAHIEYDGTDLLIRPAVVGAGDVVLSGGRLETADAEGVVFGDGKDAKIVYDGTDLVITPADVGAGDVVINGGSLEFDDSEGATFGTGKDATIQYDGTNLVINPQAVGSGLTNFSNGTVQALAGTSSSTFRMGGALDVSATQTGTDADTNEKTLHSVSLAANAMAGADAIQIHAWGTTSTNSTAKTVRLKFGSTTLVTSVDTSTSRTRWDIMATVRRTGATSQDAYARAEVSSATTAAAVQTADFTTPAETMSSGITIALTGENGTGNANDITFEGWTIVFQTQ